MKLKITILRRPLSFQCFLFFILAISQPNYSLLYSQTPTYISGRILDANSDAPVPFATVWLQNNLLGVVANSEADFRIKNNPAFKGDSLVISCIGYERLVLPFDDLVGKDLTIISLNPAIYDLNEVQVIKLKENLDSRKIIIRALRRLPKNYPKKPFSYVSYYRDYQKRNGEYINLNEAIIQTLDKGFRSKSETNKYRLLEYKKNEDFQRIPLSPYYDSIIYPNYNNPNKLIPRAKLGDQHGNELLVLLVHDAIRNYRTNSFSFIDTLMKDFLRNHEFSSPTPVFNNDLLLYKIDFTTSSRITLDSLLVEGSIYIEPRDYTIHKLEYSCGYQAETERKNIYSIVTEYGYEDAVDPHMGLKYISFNNVFNTVDTTDENYFRILDSYWKQDDLSRKPVMLFKFNRPLDPESARNKQNFQIVNIENPPRIEEIEVVGERLTITLQRINNLDILKKLRINMFNIKDIGGDNLNQRRYLEFYQYRELFVQEFNKPITFLDSCYIEQLPLEHNCISKNAGSNKYWMNTPIGLPENK